MAATAVLVAASLLCITFHETCHGLVAYWLGDPTAKRAGRLTLNPLRHIDIGGLLMMALFRFGWAKPVPVDMRYFKHPKRDMALTEITEDSFRTISARQDEGDVAYAFNKYHLISAPVVDDDDRLVGVITIDDAMSVLDEEHEEDILLLAGVGDESSMSDTVVETARQVTGHPIQAVIEPRRAGDPAVLIATSDKARAVLGWKPEHDSLEEIIATAWQWHSTHPDGYGK